MSQNTLTIKQIEEILPQRYPFLFIDKILDYKENDYLIAVKNITGNEWALGESRNDLTYFPEALLVEAAAQAAIVFYHMSKNLSEEHPYYIVGKIDCNLKKPVYIGSDLIIKVKIGKFLRSGGYVFVSAEVESKEVLTMEFFFNVKR